MSKDWYRKKTWTAADQEEFFSKLSRAPKENRPQYLKVQALELMRTGRPGLLDVAEKLLNQLLAEYPDDKVNKSASLHTLGKIHHRRKDFETALEYYQQAVDFETEYPNVKTGVDIDFSELVVKLNKTQYFDLAQKLMEANIEKAFFPVEQYKASSILAAIHKMRGEHVEFERYKKLAEESAAQKTSNLKNHPDLGLVKKRDSLWDRIFKKR